MPDQDAVGMVLEQPLTFRWLADHERQALEVSRQTLDAVQHVYLANFS